MKMPHFVIRSAWLLGSIQPRVAAGLGIPVDRVFLVTFAVGSGLAGLGGALGADILGMDAMIPVGRKPSTAFQTDDAGAPNSTMSWAMTFLNARAGTIYAGSSQIQRNIIGEMVLGLPKEPKPS